MSKDKTPDKTHLALWFWEGSRAKFECPGYYFHLEPCNLMLGAGTHTFSKPLLQTYRDSVVNPDHRTTLVEAVESISHKGAHNIGGEHHKRLPRGYEAEQHYADLLRYNGLTVGIETEIPETLYTADLVDYCMARYEDMSPIHR